MTVAIRLTIESNEKTFYVDSLVNESNNMTDERAAQLLDKVKNAASKRLTECKVIDAEYIPPQSCSVRIAITGQKPQKITWNHVYYKVLVVKEHKGVFYMEAGAVLRVCINKCPLFLSFEAKQILHRNVFELSQKIYRNRVYDIAEITPDEYFRLMNLWQS